MPSSESRAYTSVSCAVMRLGPDPRASGWPSIGWTVLPTTLCKASSDDPSWRVVAEKEIDGHHPADDDDKRANPGARHSPGRRRTQIAAHDGARHHHQSRAPDDGAAEHEREERQAVD